MIEYNGSTSLIDHPYNPDIRDYRFQNFVKEVKKNKPKIHTIAVDSFKKSKSNAEMTFKDTVVNVFKMDGKLYAWAHSASDDLKKKETYTRGVVYESEKILYFVDTVLDIVKVWIYRNDYKVLKSREKELIKKMEEALKFSHTGEKEKWKKEAMKLSFGKLVEGSKINMACKYAIMLNEKELKMLMDDPKKALKLNKEQHTLASYLMYDKKANYHNDVSFLVHYGKTYFTVHFNPSHGTPCSFWTRNGMDSLISDTKNYDAVIQEMERFNGGLQRCSNKGCHNTFPVGKHAGSWFAGVYCKSCWEGGIKQKEAKQNYE